jgi:hypothetical protein
MPVYGDLTPFERTMAEFAHRISIVAALEVSGKMKPEEAYKEIRSLYKTLKKERKRQPEQ